MKYTTNKVPKNYKCSNCGRKGCKLWRQYQIFVDQVELLCSNCGRKSQGVEYDIDQKGYHLGRFNIKSDQIGWLVPAVPTEDERTYWGYTSVPEMGVKWWRNLSI